MEGCKIARLSLLLVGDSDISRWPAQLLPTVPHVSSSDKRRHSPVVVNGRCGATLNEVVGMVRTTLDEIDETGKGGNDDDDEGAILIVCAGENDIGMGRSVEHIVSSLDEVLDVAFPRKGGSPCTSERSHDQRSRQLHAIFLGPKFEPWLIDDHSARKSYVKLSKALRRATERHHQTASITYVDCLTMFCGLAPGPGAVMGGRAVPERRFFCEDELHLSEEGYRMWKGMVEDAVAKIIL